MSGLQPKGNWKRRSDAVRSLLQDRGKRDHPQQRQRSQSMPPPQSPKFIPALFVGASVLVSFCDSIGIQSAGTR